MTLQITKELCHSILSRYKKRLKGLCAFYELRLALHTHRSFFSLLHRKFTVWGMVAPVCG